MPAQPLPYSESAVLLKGWCEASVALYLFGEKESDDEM